MLDLFWTLVTFFRRRRGARTDGLVFQLHYRLTVALLLLFSLVVGFRQYVWSPIVCYNEIIPHYMLDAYCWTHSTFTVFSAQDPTAGEEPLPGINRIAEGVPLRNHRYYQWVVLCLFFQAVLFFIPKWLWIRWEGGKLKKLKNNLCSGFESDEEKLKRSEHVLEYLSSNLHHHEWWAKKYFLSEALAFVNVLGQMFLMNRFLGGVFWNYGTEVLNFIETDSEKRVDPMIAVFPEVAQCTFRKFGSSGVIQRHDVICVLPLNLLNQKLYTFLWFWSVFLLVITGLCLLYRLALLYSTNLRLYVIRKRHPQIRGNVLESIVRSIQPGDWLLLYLLGENVDPEVFMKLIHELVHKVVESRDDKIEFMEVL